VKIFSQKDDGCLKSGMRDRCARSWSAIVVGIALGDQNLTNELDASGILEKGNTNPVFRNPGDGIAINISEGPS
jgi:hypothetical protein